MKRVIISNLLFLEKIEWIGINLNPFSRFTRYDWLAIFLVGILTPLIDSRVEVWLPQFFFNIHTTVNIFTYTGGPINGDLLVAWEEYGAVLASYLVRKPGAATLAMAINGFGAVFLGGLVSRPAPLGVFCRRFRR